MKPLLLKEYLVNRQSLFLNPIIMIVSSLYISRFDQIPLFIGVVFSCLQPINNEINEGMNKSETLMNSLPVSRKKIVLSKYLFSIIIGTSYLIIIVFLNAVIPGFTSTTSGELMIGFTAVMLFLSIYLLLSYFFGPRFFIIAFFLFVIVLFGAVYPIINLGAKYNYWGMIGMIDRFSTVQVAGVLLLLSCTCLMLSFILSYRLYLKKDF